MYNKRVKVQSDDIFRFLGEYVLFLFLYKIDDK